MSDDPTSEPRSRAAEQTGGRRSRGAILPIAELLALLLLFFVYAGDHAPAVNEAHYLVKAKNFWAPSWCAGDLFASSGKAHTTFYLTFGALTQWFSLGATAWIGRFIGWTMIAIGLVKLCRALGLPTFASLGVATLWLAGIEYGNLAGEWVVGGIEGKVPAYGAALIGLAEIAKRNWSRGWIWFGIASAFHVLTGGWMVIAASIAFFFTERLTRDSDSPKVPFFSVGLFLGGAISLFGLIPAIGLTFGASAEESAAAARIYSFVRIRHHLLPGDFPASWFIRHGVLVATLLLLFLTVKRDDRNRRVAWVGMGALVIAGCGLLVGLLPASHPDLAAKLLRYYWFRLSDMMVPLTVALLLMGMFKPDRSIWLRAIASLLLVMSVGLVATSAWNRHQVGVPPSTSHRLLGIRPDASPQDQRAAHRDWLAVCGWIRAATPKEEIFFTPRHQQTFKWYAHRAEVVNWKDVPQDAKSLIEWERRFNEIYPQRLGRVRVTIQYLKLREYREKFGVRFMVVDHRVVGRQLPLVKVYPRGDLQNKTYSVYELPY